MWESLIERFLILIFIARLLCVCPLFTFVFSF